MNFVQTKGLDSCILINNLKVDSQMRYTYLHYLAYYNLIEKQWLEVIVYSSRLELANWVGCPSLM